MSTDTLLLPLTYQAQQRLEQTKHKIIYLHGPDEYPARLGQALSADDLSLGEQEALPTLDKVLAVGIDETSDLHRVAAHYGGNLALLLQRFGGHEVKLGKVEAKVEHLNSEVSKMRLEHLESMNGSARYQNGQARDLRDQLKPLRVPHFDEDLKLSFQIPDNFPTTLSYLFELKTDISDLLDLLKVYRLKVLRPETIPSMTGSPSEYRTIYTPIDLESSEEVQTHIDDCFYEFARHIGVKRKVYDPRGP
ncbi:hypothetical protein ABW21_db0205150 [Orbilia brochopaga]|nr:hypothetical protein ABW21_db0205150 [Drechslerella brochopaga]